MTAPASPPLLPPLDPATSRRRAVIVAAIAILLTLLAFVQMPGLNGPWYWQWMYRRVPLLDNLPFILLASFPALAAIWLYPRRINAGVGLFLLALSLFAMQFACARRADDPWALGRLTTLLGDTVNNSYFRSAGILIEDGHPDQPHWLANYPSLMNTLYLHAKNKPPGLVLLHFPIIHRLGFNPLAATVSGLYMAILVPLSVPATYLLLRTLTHDRTASFLGTAILPFTPGILFFFPYWDPFFPVFTAALVVPWARAVDTGRPLYAILFGLALAVAIFFTFNLLVLGVFLAGYALYNLFLSPSRPTLLKLLRLTALSLLTLTAAYFVFHLLTGYNPLLTLQAGIANQHELEGTFLKRPFPAAIPFDLFDFLLGTGWVCTLTLAFFLRDQFRAPDWRSPGLQATLLFLAQLLIVACTGLLSVETARVWTFLIPLFLVPTSLEIARWQPRDRLVIYLSLLLVVIGLNQNMRFVVGT